MMSEPTRVQSLYRELITENAMTDEAIRFVRKSWRGNNQGGVIANIIVVSLLGMMYAWLMVAMVKWDLTFTLQIEYVQLVAVTLIAPATVYAAISGEREKATWDALILTRLSAAQIIAGKLAWRILTLAGVMALLLLMILVSQTQGRPDDHPTAAVVLLGQVMIFAWGVFLTVFGLWISAKTNRSVTSIGVIIGATLGALAMVPALLAAFEIFGELDNPVTFKDWLGVFTIGVNPFFLLGSVTESSRRVGASLVQSPEWMLIVIALYLVATGLLLWLTHNTLKRMTAD
jgi:ABC-type transport system involved in multi-copper enzyme maturation permease subunit